MPKAKTLTPAAVAALGAERLAALLLQAAEYDPALMRSVRHRSPPLVTDWQGHPPHAEYAAGLRQRHPRKSSFWSRVRCPRKQVAAGGNSSAFRAMSRPTGTARFRFATDWSARVPTLDPNSGR